jgi:hypothetical protein
VTSDAQRDPVVVTWLSGLDESLRREVEFLASVVASADAGLEQAIKWGQLTFTVGGNWHHWICGIAATKKGAKLVLHKGALLDDPHRLLQGSGRYLRDIPVKRVRQDPAAVRGILRSAVDHQTDM